MPKAWIYDKQQKNKLNIVYPDEEIEVPDWITLAEEILEAELEAAALAEKERIRILNITPVAFLSEKQRQKL